MTWGELAAQADGLRAHGPVEVPYQGGFRTRDLARVTSDMIAWQESGFSTDGMALPPVFAVVRLIASSIDQLPLVADFEPNDWLYRPRRLGSDFDLGDIVQWCVSSMALHGSADLACTPVGDGSWKIEALHPGSVHCTVTASAEVRFKWTFGGEDIEPVPALMADWRRRLKDLTPIRQRTPETDDQIKRLQRHVYGGDPSRSDFKPNRYLLHIPYLVTPQHPAGCTPVTVARESLMGYFAVERQASDLLNKGTYSGGRLETDQDITAATAKRWQAQWVEDRADGLLPVTGAGLRYVNDLISPTDAQWLESRQFNSQQIAMMFGVPPDYLGMTASGGSSSLSYANSQDNDRRFRRNCLEAFTSQIEDAFSQLAPQGRAAGEAGTIRFDYSGWEASGDENDAVPTEPGP